MNGGYLNAFMAQINTKDIRNFTFIGHGDSGKTSLMEMILYKTSATSRLGSVADGTSICDSDVEEKDRKSSIDAAIVNCMHKGREFNGIDCPGYPDFAGEAVSALSAVETAFICVNASSGVMVNTRKMWEAAVKAGVCKAIAINKIDLENINFDELLGVIQETFGKECKLVQISDATGNQLSTIVNLLSPPDKVLPHLKDKFNMYREQLVETVVEADDAVLERYLEGTQISPEEISRCATLAILKGKLVPIFLTSTKKELGIMELIDFISNYLPSPADVGPKQGTGADAESAEKSLAADPSAPFSARVFKCLADPFVGKLTFFRVYSGTLVADNVIFNPRTGKTDKVAKVFKVFGKDQKTVDKITAGEIGAFARIEDVSVPDTICTQADVIKYPVLSFPKPMVSLAVEPKSRADEQKISASLSKLADSDPTFTVARDRQTHELVVNGMSNLHLDIVLERLKRKFDVAVSTKPTKIAYLETVTNKADGHHKHKKQSGGRGQYGEVYLKIEPLERGKGFEFGNEIFGGSIPGQYVPAIEKGVKEIMEKGVIAGHTMVDIKTIVYDGSYHEVDSDEHSFKIAGARAFADAVHKARPVLLEPVVNIEITIPSKFMGDITGNLISRRGRIHGMDAIRDMQVIKAQVPLSEILTYSTELHSITGGEGSYAIEFSHYDIVPAKIQEAIVAKAVVHKEED